MSKRRVVSGCVRSKSVSCSRTKSKPVQGESPVEKRCGLSIDDLAFMAARKARGERFNHPLKKEANGLMCEAIRRMVYKVAGGYTQSCNEGVDDLAQDCLRRISSRIGSFDPNKAKFTTWAWSVCRSVLTGAYRRESSRNKHISSVDLSELRGASEPRVNFDDSLILRTEILEAIEELAVKYPKQRPLIVGIFGDFVTKRMCSTKLTISKAAKKVGMTYHDACLFVDGVVRPHFKSRFAVAA